MRPSGWLLIIGALAAIVVGLLLNGPVCPGSSASTPGCDSFQFPVPIVSGVAVAMLLIGVLVIRRRPGRPRVFPAGLRPNRL